MKDGEQGKKKKTPLYLNINKEKNQHAHLFIHEPWDTAKRINLEIYGLEEEAEVTNGPKNLFNKTYNPKFPKYGNKLKYKCSSHLYP